MATPIIAKSVLGNMTKNELIHFEYYLKKQMETLSIVVNANNI